MSDFWKLTDQLRQHVCQGRIRREVDSRGAECWDNLCTSMDVLEDTQLALHAFLEHPENEDAGEMYLATYGVLEALNLQQDAILNIGTALGLPQSPDKDLMRIREYRKDLAGHPIRTRGEESTNGIVRNNSTSKNVEYHKRPKGGGLKVLSVDLVKEVGVQNRAIDEMVGAIVKSLGEIDASHKAKFATESLQSLFPSGLGYEVSKLYEAASSRKSPYWELAGIHLKGILGCIEKMEEALKARGEYESGEPVAYEITETKETIERLRVMFENAEDTLGLTVFISYVEKKLEALKGMAKEYDEEYGATSPGTTETETETNSTLKFVDE